MLYEPKTKEELKSLVDDLSINLGDIDTSKIVDMSFLFCETKRTDFSGIEKWDVSNVRNMTAMFSYAKAFNHPIGKWNTKNVEDMSGMFRMAKAFNQHIGNWDVSGVKNMSMMFSGAKSFNADISKWNVSKVENMSHMFEYAESFNQDISSWNIKRLKNCSYMFSKAKSFNQDLSSWNINKIKEINGMFDGTIKSKYETIEQENRVKTLEAQIRELQETERKNSILINKIEQLEEAIKDLAKHLSVLEEKNRGFFGRLKPSFFRKKSLFEELQIVTRRPTTFTLND